jgi:hypothetical protein
MAVMEVMMRAVQTHEFQSVLQNGFKAQCSEDQCPKLNAQCSMPNAQGPMHKNHIVLIEHSALSIGH